MCLEVRGLRPNWSGYKPALSSSSDACLPDGASNGSTLQTLALPSRAVCSGVSSPSFSLSRWGGAGWAVSGSADPSGALECSRGPLGGQPVSPVDGGGTPVARQQARVVDDGAMPGGTDDLHGDELATEG